MSEIVKSQKEGKLQALDAERLPESLTLATKKKACPQEIMILSVFR
jgi:hypothetical protein